MRCQTSMSRMRTTCLPSMEEGWVMQVLVGRVQGTTVCTCMLRSSTSDRIRNHSKRTAVASRRRLAMADHQKLSEA